MIDADEGRTIIDKLALIDPALRRASDLFGPRRWWPVRLFRFLSRQPIPPSLLLLGLWLTPALPKAIRAFNIFAALLLVGSLYPLLSRTITVNTASS